MSNVGSNIFLIDRSATDRNPCICGQPSCPKIRACFQSIGDARGLNLALPSLGGSRNAAIKEYKLRRICHHLGLGEENFEQYATTDTRNRSITSLPTPGGSPPNDSTRNKNDNPMRSKKCIAVHHFHPEVIQLFVTNNKFQFFDYLTESFVLESGLWQNGYTHDDYFPGEAVKSKGKKLGRVFVTVPTYTNALEDYRRAAIRYRICDIIKSCNDAMENRNDGSGASFLGRADDDENDDEEDTLQPLNKKGRFSTMNAHDLQRAVCVLAADVEQLEIKNKRLEQQLEVEKTRNDRAAIEDLFQSGIDLPK
mmetsp:Transcript_21540/g.46813  ORF Transcript_21540/g.46813 Transcript_21540/m.46813 type:complete len:309 (-) Transcript_21540:139-1065(-)